ncbi:MAG TPA: four helix bundle protein [Kofleriaceae bacterium]|nr:four helix bundle protein [Kofleriaceae bacterium]
MRVSALGRRGEGAANNSQRKAPPIMLVAYTNALQIIRTLRPIVEQLKSYDANAADQVVRAATSITHNVAEGSRRTGKDRKCFYRRAAGSASEVLAALDTADAWGWNVNTAEARVLLDRELALLWGLCR